MGHTKVFVGNLSFKTREADLASEFTSVGRVVSANIITRGSRSLGYGFVELESEDDAQKAIVLMNKKSIDTREINVELARPRDETKLGERRRPPINRRGRGGNRGGYYNMRGGGGNRYRPRAENQGEDQPLQNPGDEAPLNSYPRRGRGGPRGRGRPRGPPYRQNNESRTQSKTTLFVANLPFSVDDNGLADIFKDFKISKAHVVKYRNRSKGFGFVEFENEEDQKAAQIIGEKLEVEGRKLIVNIALTENRKPRDEASNNNNNNNNNDNKKVTTTSIEEKTQTKTK